jgi:hypothetical protein
MTKKPDVTRTNHLLPFGELSPAQFERLCLWLVKAEGYIRAEHLGEAGNDQGRDVIAYRQTGSGEQLWYFQCKRYQTISASTLLEEIEKYNELVKTDPAEKPFGIVFVTNATLSAKARKEARKTCAKHGYECEFWAHTELDLLVKKYKHIVAEFFNLPIGVKSIQTFSEPIPRPPSFYAEPPYIGSHKFVGRKAQLKILSDWASPADARPVFLFDAIGGNGKSMLVWEWISNQVTRTRVDWAGRFWYSFYEKGAVMADFCQRALAYITGRSIKSFQRKKTAELGESLLRHLRTRPWLLVLDGLERVLVAYHRIDAAQVADEKAGTSDEIAHRNPCSAIHPEDDDLLRLLAVATPSKILITSRLTPTVLLNAANQPIPGVLRRRLPGLQPTDAEALLRSCGISGTSKDIQNYLRNHCACHPLVTGVLAGLINSYLPNRGNFDDWVDDPVGGGLLNLADLDLVQKRNHILYTALAALPGKSRQLLSTLALLSELVDYETLRAFNPHLPAEPEFVAKFDRPEDKNGWELLSDEQKQQAKQGYQVALKRRKEYEEALIAREHSSEYRAALQELEKTVGDLERRGLLQYDNQAKRYDLHPVVRAIAAGGLQQEEKERYGQRVVDHFSRQSHNPYNEAKKLEDLRDGIQIVRTLLQMKRYRQAYDTYIGDLDSALSFNLEAYAEALSLIRPFFPDGWTTLPKEVEEKSATFLINNAAWLLSEIGELGEALTIFGASLIVGIQQKHWRLATIRLSNIALTLSDQNRLAKSERYRHLAHDLATLFNDDEQLFSTRLHLFNLLVQLGKWEDAETMWQLLDPMGRAWSRLVYRPGNAELCYAQFRFLQGDLQEEHLVHAEQLAKADRSRKTIRYLHRLRGDWQLEQCQWALAANSLHKTVNLAREVGQSDEKANVLHAIAKFHLKQSPDLAYEVEQLAAHRRC